MLFSAPCKQLSTWAMVALCWLAVFSPLASRAEKEGAWDITKIEGQEYVSAESVKNFYNFTKISRSGGAVTLENSKVEMKLNVGSQECLMNNVKFVFCYPVEEQGGKVFVSRVDLAKLIDPVLRPNFIGNAGDFRTVILDPGHGGKDQGATNALGTEANYNFKLALSVKKLLEAKGFKVVMTRTSDVYISLQERVDLANAVKENAIFISLHLNTTNGSSAHGIETFTLSPTGIAHYGSNYKPSDSQDRLGNEHDSANIALATALHGSMLRRLGKNTFDRGIKRARFSVLSGVTHPAILFEGGFMSHPYESRLIDNPAYQTALANGVVDAITKYRFAVGRNTQQAGAQ